MSDFATALQQLITSSTTNAKEMNHGRWTSSRLWVVVAFVAIVLFGAYFALQPAPLDIIAPLVIWFIALTTFSKVAFGFFNTWMWVVARRLAGQDLSEDEKKELSNLTPKA